MNVILLLYSRADDDTQGIYAGLTGKKLQNLSEVKSSLNHCQLVCMSFLVGFGWLCVV